MSSLRQMAGSARSIVAGEFVMTAADFRCIAEMIYGDSGISLSESKALLVYSRLAKRIRALELTSFAEYCELVQSANGAEERGNMLSALTTNVTRFFREPHHFTHLAKTILPSALDSAKQGRTRAPLVIRLLERARALLNGADTTPTHAQRRPV